MIQAEKLFLCCKTLGPFRLVLVDVENGEQLGDEENVSDSLAQVRELHLAALIPDRRERSHQSSHASTVNVGYIGKVDEDVLVSTFEQCFDLLTQRTHFVPDDDLALRDQHANVTRVLRLKRNCHLFAPLSLVTVYLLELPELSEIFGQL
jgi:hypothetical protein